MLHVGVTKVEYFPGADDHGYITFGSTDDTHFVRNTAVDGTSTYGKWSITGGYPSRCIVGGMWTFYYYLNNEVYNIPGSRSIANIRSTNIQTSARYGGQNNLTEERPGSIASRGCKKNVQFSRIILGREGV